MKKSKAEKNKLQDITPEEAVEFIESMRRMASEIDEPTVAISLRIPGNLLRATKLKAKADGKKYQSLMVELIRKGLRNHGSP